jgi:hypothetical protein
LSVSLVLAYESVNLDKEDSVSTAKEKTRRKYPERGAWASISLNNKEVLAREKPRFFAGCVLFDRYPSLEIERGNRPP